MTANPKLNSTHSIILTIMTPQTTTIISHNPDPYQTNSMAIMTSVPIKIKAPPPKSILVLRKSCNLT